MAFWGANFPFSLFEFTEAKMIAKIKIIAPIISIADKDSFNIKIESDNATMISTRIKREDMVEVKPFNPEDHK